MAAGLLFTAGLLAQPILTKDNIPEVVRAMSLEEKACLVVGFNNGWPGYDPGLPGTGGMTYPLPRYGIPSIVMMDGPTGVRLEPDWNDGQGWGKISYDYGFAMSSNIGVASILENVITKKELKVCYDKFGFGKINQRNL